jgi:hypothetical protein
MKIPETASINGDHYPTKRKTRKVHKDASASTAASFSVDGCIGDHREVYHSEHTVTSIAAEYEECVQMKNDPRPLCIDILNSLRI